MNPKVIYVASKDIIFLFRLNPVQQLMQIKVPNHLLRISLNPITREADGSRLPENQIAYSNDLEDGTINFVRFSAYS